MMPIRSLRHNIPYNFESSNKVNKELLRNYVESGLLNSTILVDDEKCNIKFPFANLDNRTIYLHEPFMSYLWGLSFSLCNWFDEYHQELSECIHDGIFHFNSPIRKISKELFIWSISLREEYSEWPSNLPVPNLSITDEFYDHALVANQIFLDAINFILYHETAHLVNGHDKYADLIIKDVDNLKYDDRMLIIQIENEADIFSLQMMFNNLDNDNDRMRIGVSVVIAGLSMLLAQNHPLGFLQSKHLDVDKRLFNIVNSILFDNEGYRDYLYIIATLGIQMFFYTFEFHREVEKYETAQDMFHSYLDSFDDMRKFSNLH